MIKVDIAIIGGGITGSSVAYFLSKSGKAGSVAVIEPDPTYEMATTPRGAGGVRQLFSVPENIRMSAYSLEFYKTFDEVMAINGEAPGANFRANGYLFVANSSGSARMLVENAKLQRAEGANVEVLDGPKLGKTFPSLNTVDVIAACHSPDDGWLDPTAAMWGFRKKAQSLGAGYIKDRVVGFRLAAHKIEAAELGSGETIAADVFINVAGPWSGEVAAMAGIDIPIKPLSRVAHFWRAAEPIEQLPFIKDDSNIGFRPEGNGFMGGRVTLDKGPGFDWDFDRGFFATYFEDAVWPLLAGRVKTFETLRLERTWGCHYSQNWFDGNMIIGPLSKKLENFLIASGFSGHGIMHAPAIGLALSELVLSDGYQTIDLTRLGVHRVHDNLPYAERGIT